MTTGSLDGHKERQKTEIHEREENMSLTAVDWFYLLPDIRLVVASSVERASRVMSCWVFIPSVLESFCHERNHHGRCIAPWPSRGWERPGENSASNQMKLV